MDTVFGIAGRDWVIIVTDTAVNRSIFTLKHDEDKIMNLNNYKIVGAAGETCDRTTFCNFIQRNLQLQEYRTGFELGVDATAQYMRTELANALRRAPYQVNIMMGGYDLQEKRAKLYWMDYLGTLQQVNKGAQGYAGYFVNSVLDNEFKADMSLNEGLEAAKKCIKELKIRFMINQHDFLAKIVTKDGIQVVELKQ